MWVRSNKSVVLPYSKGAGNNLIFSTRDGIAFKKRKKSALIAVKITSHKYLYDGF
jgi:hypothetical protein